MLLVGSVISMAQSSLPTPQQEQRHTYEVQHASELDAAKRYLSQLDDRLGTHTTPRPQENRLAQNAAPSGPYIPSRPRMNTDPNCPTPVSQTPVRPTPNKPVIYAEYFSEAVRPNCKIDYAVYWKEHFDLTEKLLIALIQQGYKYEDAPEVAFHQASKLLHDHGIEPNSPPLDPANVKVVDEVPAGAQKLFENAASKDGKLFIQKPDGKLVPWTKEEEDKLPACSPSLPPNTTCKPTSTQTDHSVVVPTAGQQQR